MRIGTEGVLRECASTPASALQRSNRTARRSKTLQFTCAVKCRSKKRSSSVGQDPILRSIGGTVVTTPQATTSVYDPALAEPTQWNGSSPVGLRRSIYQRSFRLTMTSPQPPAVQCRALVIASFTQRQNATFSNELSKQTATGILRVSHSGVSLITQEHKTRGSTHNSSLVRSKVGSRRNGVDRGGAAGTTYNRIARRPNFSVWSIQRNPDRSSE